MWEYIAKVTKVVDGDTIYATVDLGFKIIKEEKFRLLDIDTAEIFKPSCNAEKEHGMLAKQFVSDLVLDKTVIIRTKKDTTGKYGRYLCDVFFSDENNTVQNLTNMLKENGFEKKEKYI